MSKEKIAPFVTLGASNHSRTGERQTEDFYATSISTIESLFPILEKHNIKLNGICIEPSVGNGNIISTVKNHCEEEYFPYLAFDIVDRGYPNTIVKDWMAVDSLPNEEKFIIGNPPYALALEHIKHGLDLLNTGEYSIHLLKIQFLEGKKRRNFFNEHPPKFIFVFSERQNCFKNNIDDGGSSAICYAWYVWEKGFKGYPTLDWI